MCRYGDPTALLLERLSMAFVLSMFKVCTVFRQSMLSYSVYWMPLLCCGDACDSTVPTSAFSTFLETLWNGCENAVRTLLGCVRGFSKQSGMKCRLMLNFISVFIVCQSTCLPVSRMKRVKLVWQETSWI